VADEDFVALVGRLLERSYHELHVRAETAIGAA
jgi:hypothetical protein